MTSGIAVRRGEIIGPDGDVSFSDGQNPSSRSPELPSGGGTEECCRGQPLSARISQRRTGPVRGKAAAVMKVMAWSAIALPRPAPPGWLRRGQRLPLGDDPDAAPRLGVVGDQRKAAAQLGHGGQLAALLQGVADGCGGRLVDGKHAVSMGPPRAMSKSRARAIIAVELGWRSVAALARSRSRPACGACGAASSSRSGTAQARLPLGSVRTGSRNGRAAAPGRCRLGRSELEPGHGHRLRTRGRCPVHQPKIEM